MRLLLTIWAALLCISASAQDLQLSLSADRCAVGEPVTLTATVRSEALHEVEFKVESMPEFLLSGAIESPVQSDGGQFIQSRAWTLQALRSGEHAIDGIRATLSRGEHNQELAATPITLVVAAPAMQELSKELAPMPGDSAPGGNTSLVLGLIVCISAALLILFNQSKKQQSSASPAFEEPEPSLNTLIAVLEGGSIPHDLIQALLAGNLLSKAQRQTLERALYARAPEAAELLDTLRKGDRA